jgi:plastocyanin
MRFLGLALLTSAFVLTGCPGEQRDTTADTAVAANGAPAAANGEAAAITGTTHVVRMVGDGQSYRFEPRNLTIQAGDGVRWEMVSGGPHNVKFLTDRIPGGAEAQLRANMPNQMSPFSSPFFMNAGETYTVSFANLPAGEYHYECTPHVQMDMFGTITVQP